MHLVPYKVPETVASSVATFTRKAPRYLLMRINLVSFATVYKIEALVFFKNVNSRASLDVSPSIQKIHVVQSSIIAVSVLGFGFRSSI